MIENVENHRSGFDGASSHGTLTFTWALPTLTPILVFTLASWAIACPDAPSASAAASNVARSKTHDFALLILPSVFGGRPYSMPAQGAGTAPSATGLKGLDLLHRRIDLVDEEALADLRTRAA